MKLTPEQLNTWLGLESRAQLAQALGASRAEITLPQARRLTGRLEELEGAGHPLRLAIVHSYTSDLLDPWLGLEAAIQGLGLDTYHAPYGFVRQEAEPGSGLDRHTPDLTLLLLQREDLHPDLAAPLAVRDADERAALQQAAAEGLLGTVGRFRALVPGQVLVTLLPALHGPGLGLFDAHSDRSELAWWAGLKQALTAGLRERFHGTLFLDLDAALCDIGRPDYFDPRLWYSARFPFTPAAARDLARRVIAIGAALKYPKAKVIALDADNTLWGGIIGEDGLNGIALGPDYPGNCYAAFQRRLLDYQSRGLILALCSKNNPADLDQVLAEHPHQLLRDGHFAARRVNWEPKPANLAALAEELSLGLDSFVFVDDSDHECAAVRHALPQVTVVQVPKNPLEVPGCLDRLARLEVLSLTSEDLAKTRLYAEERRRRDRARQMDAGGGGLDEYLHSLGMRMRIVINDASHLARLAQLTNKTNQFNLTTRRYDEQRMQAFLDADDHWVAHFSLADVFGDSGVVGLAIARRLDGELAELDTLLMSCRVIGRRAESAFLESLLRLLAEAGITQVVADYLPTAKNGLAEGFLPKHGFIATADGRFLRDLAQAPPRPAADFPIAVELAR
jgi:FkbH-like protein